MREKLIGNHVVQLDDSNHTAPVVNVAWEDGSIWRFPQYAGVRLTWDEADRTYHLAVHIVRRYERSRVEANPSPP